MWESPISAAVTVGGVVDFGQIGFYREVFGFESAGRLPDIPMIREAGS
jgi:hypothetical protein